MKVSLPVVNEPAASGALARVLRAAGLDRDEHLAPGRHPRAPSWRNLWLRIALSGTALLIMIFGGYELIERLWLEGAPPSVIYALHLARGMGSAVLVGSWSFYLVMRTRRYYEALLGTTVQHLETVVRERTEELERSQAFLEHLFDSLRDRIIVIDRSGRVVKANRVARTTAGEVLEGRICTDVFRECDNRCEAHAILAGRRRPEQLTRSDARTGRIWSIAMYPMPAREGEPELLLEVARDVTDEKRLEAQMRHQEKMASLGVLASGIAHDIGNPLASLSSELEMLEVEDDANAMRESLGVLRTHVDRIGRTLREMVDFARRRGEELGDVSVSTAVDDALRLVRHDKRMRNVMLATDVPNDLPPVRMVEDHLVMVLVNLVLNALDAMPAGGTLEVRARHEDDAIRLLVKDTGTGMTKDVLDRVFEPLFTTKGDRGGTGLGLPVSQSVVHAAGGRMHVESAPGTGTAVGLVLPAGGVDE